MGKHGGKHHFSKEEKEYIISEFESGVKQLHIAQKLGVGLTPVRRVLITAGLITCKRHAKYKDRPEVQDELMQRIECKCPRCLTTHFRYLYWSGSLPARVRCKNCEEFVTHGDGMFLENMVSI